MGKRWKGEDVHSLSTPGSSKAACDRMITELLPTNQKKVLRARNPKVRLAIVRCKEMCIVRLEGEITYAIGAANHRIGIPIQNRAVKRVFWVTTCSPNATGSVYVKHVLVSQPNSTSW